MPVKPIAKSFRAPLVRKPGRLNWVVVRVPFDAAKVWGKRGQIKIKGEINNFGFRTSLFPDGQGNHYLLVNKKMQKGGGVPPGEVASFRLEPDTEVRSVEVPRELERAMRQDRQLHKFYESLNYSTRREIAKVVSGGKQAETRARRSEQMAERLMETMEAERELPPVMKATLARNPQARAGWERMPPSLKRGTLLGIFYYRNPESRARRLEKAIGLMLEQAQKGKNSTAD